MGRPLPWSLEPIADSHDRVAFDCGSSALNEFLRQYARQNEIRGISRTFVATRRGDKQVLGYFTVRAGEIEIQNLRAEHARRLPRYPVPSLHVARLAVDRAAQGKGLGEYLLMCVVERAAHASKDIGVYAIEVVAESGSAKSFYERYGFVELGDSPLHLYLTVETARRSFAGHPD